LLLTPSAFTAAELNRQLRVPAKRVRVFGGAAALDARDATVLSPPELRGLGIEPPFVLRYGGYTRRKNVPLLLEAWARIRLGTLVLAGPPQQGRATMLAQAPSLDRVVVLDYVSQELLARLLRSATALVSTSSYEGFGLPPLEALAVGTPVVAVTAPFVQEICGDAALLVEARPEALADALVQILVDSELARQLRSKGPRRAANFTWSAAAANVLRAYASASMST
jgi:glycosyltransferase involved in cell wall biosynthesis